MHTDLIWYVISISIKLLQTKRISVWCWWRDRHQGHWDRRENPETDPHKYAQLIFARVQKPFNRKKVEFLTNNAIAIGQHRQTKMNLKSHTLHKSEVKMDHRLKTGKKSSGSED